jgi:hypothetical protein
MCTVSFGGRPFAFVQDYAVYNKHLPAGSRRQQVAYGRERGLSARRACTLFSVARLALEYRSRKGAKDAPVVTRMKELST